MSNLNVNLLNLEDIRILKGELNSPFEARVSEIVDFATNMDFELKIDMEAEHIIADFSVVIEALFQNTTDLDANAQFKLAFVFSAGNFNELISPNEDYTCEVDEGLLNAVASITYSTSRGILLTRFQGTLFRDFVLPIIHPNTLFSTDK